MLMPQNVDGPSISLPDSVKKVQQLYNEAQDRPVEGSVIANAWNYRSLHGSYYAGLAALTDYGLLEADGEQYKLSSSALKLLSYPKGSIDRARVILRAAFAPPLFAELRKMYGYQPPDESNLKATFVMKGLTRSKVDDVARAYRNTLEFVNEETKGYNIESLIDLDSEVPMQSQTFKQNNAGNIGMNGLSSASKNEDDLSLKLAKYCKVNLQFIGPATQEAVKKLVDLMQREIETFPTEKELGLESDHQLSDVSA